MGTVFSLPPGPWLISGPGPWPFSVSHSAVASLVSGPTRTWPVPSSMMANRLPRLNSVIQKADLSSPTQSQGFSAVADILTSHV